MNNKISIIVPYFNNHIFAKDLFESIKCQTYKNLEVIIIDDGSGENSSNLLLKEIDIYKNYISITYKKIPNSGPSVARNIALDMITGEYVTFLDSDDMLCGKYSLESRIEFLEANPGYNAVAGYALKVQTDGKILHSKPSKTTENILRELANSAENLPERYIDYYLQKRRLLFYVIGNTVFKKDLISNIRFDPDFLRIQDLEWFVRLFKNNLRLKLIKVPVFLRRIHENQNHKKTTNEDEIQTEQKLLKIKEYISAL